MTLRWSSNPSVAFHPRAGAHAHAFVRAEWRDRVTMEQCAAQWTMVDPLDQAAPIAMAAPLLPRGMTVDQAKQFACAWIADEERDGRIRPMRQGEFVDVSRREEEEGKQTVTSGRRTTGSFH